MWPCLPCRLYGGTFAPQAAPRLLPFDTGTTPTDTLLLFFSRPPFCARAPKGRHGSALNPTHTTAGPVFLRGACLLVPFLCSFYTPKNARRPKLETPPCIAALHAPHNPNARTTPQPLLATLDPMPTWTQCSTPTLGPHSSCSASHLFILLGRLGSCTCGLGGAMIESAARAR